MLNTTKHIITILITTAVLAACVSNAQRQRMQQLLDRADSLNSCGQPLPNDSTLLAAIDFYDRHGSSNEQMRAHYLLGCAYADRGEAPQALDAFHDAIDAADTTSANCNFRQLSRVYGQMAELFKQQFLWNEMLAADRQCEQMSWRAKDTLSAIIAVENQSIAYAMLQDSVQELTLKEKAAHLYERCGYLQDKALLDGELCYSYIKVHDYKKARQCMNNYESRSGVILPDGEIKQAHRIYYYYKGLYYLGTERLDSAEHYFRQLLVINSDANHMEAGNYGLLLVYKQQHVLDSIAKYAECCYQVNNQRQILSSTDELRHIQGMYYHGRDVATEKAQQLKYERARFLLLLSVSVGIILIILLVSIVRSFIRKRQQLQASYRAKLSELMRHQKEQLQLSERQMDDLVRDKTAVIERLSLEIDKYHRLHYDHSALSVDRQMQTAEISMRLHRIARQAVGASASDKDWDALQSLFNEMLPGFYPALNTNSIVLKKGEYLICMLVRLHFEAYEICNLLNENSSNISMKRSRLAKKLFGEQMSAKEFDHRIQQMTFQ